MGKIIVIGAGQGGLVAAKHLKNFGHDVVVYEAESRENAAHPWRDDIRRAVFEEAGLTPIPVSDCVQKNKWKFVSPDEKSTLRVPMTPPLEEIAIDRRYLLEYLLKECEGVEVHFNSPVENLITDGDKVAGVRVNGKDVRADMVIDASGYNSKFRREVPKKFGIPEPESDDKFCAFRGYYRADLNKNLPNPPCTLYIKHLGGVGISWCNLSQDNVADVLVGRIGSLSDEELERAKTSLLKNHDFNTGEPIVERRVDISLRYPAGVLVADGYAIVGDSAYMTMPMMGSGIESAMKAGRMLAETIGTDCDFSAKSLYPYQLKFYKQFGFLYVFVDVLKRWALNLPDKDVNWAFSSGLVTDDDMALLSTDENAKGLSFLTILKKIGILFKNFSLVCRAVKYAARGLNAMAVAKRIPKNYDADKVRKWSEKLDKKVRGKKKR